MNILAKSIILISILFLSGCAHHSGYYSGRSSVGAIGISVDTHIPFRSYSRHYDHDNYRHRSTRHKRRDHYSHYDKHYDDDRNYGRHYSSRRNWKKNHSNHENNRHYQDYSHHKGKKGRGGHWNARGARHDYYSRR